MNKEHILQEIKRTAEENGGVPLGWRRFFSETGIKESHWMGIHWAPWGDAVREAGFAPNEFQSAYDKTELLERYAKLTQELGRIPTSDDLRLKAHDDSTFPSDKTFDRLGAKSELVGQLLEYCRSRKGYDGVVVFCEEYAPRSLEASDQAEHQEGEIGFVYLIKSGRFYKIGKTNAAGRREYELKIQLPKSHEDSHYPNRRPGRYRGLLAQAF